MPKYTVEFPLYHKRKKYMPEDVVEMSEKLAAPLLAKDALSPVGESGSDITEEAVVAAISKMEPQDGDQWTNDGKPQLPALEALLGEKVSAPMRDAAWKRYQLETAA